MARARKLLVICGPTATGKTKLAIFLAKKFGGELVSSDSRQVYKEMDIGTGKDLPSSAVRIVDHGLQGIPYYVVDGIRIWGYDLVDPKEEFSVSQYLGFVGRIIESIYSRHSFPILVGGTGLYIKAVVDGLDTAHIPKDRKLREILENYSLDELFERLSVLDPVKAASMNSSDRKNPRRLVRAIEVAQNKLTEQNYLPSTSSINRLIDERARVLILGLRASIERLEKNIVKRVEHRIKKGIKEEIKKLIKKGVSWDSQSMTSLGHRQWKGYFDDGAPEELVVRDWIKEEVRYAKRQMAWFKRDRRIIWFDAESGRLNEEVENVVQKWYDQINGKEN